MLTDNTLPQRWLVQVLTFDGDKLQTVERVPVAEDGTASIAIDDLGGRVDRPSLPSARWCRQRPKRRYIRTGRGVGSKAPVGYPASCGIIDCERADVAFAPLGKCAWIHLGGVCG